MGFENVDYIVGAKLARPITRAHGRLPWNATAHTSLFKRPQLRKEMKNIFYFNIVFVIFGLDESGRDDKIRGIPDELLGRFTDCSRGGDQVSSVEKYLVLPKYPKPQKTPIKCEWHLSSGSNVRISMKQLKMPCNGQNMLIITDGKVQSLKYTPWPLREFL